MKAEGYVEFDHLTYEARSGVAHVVLDRPEKRNALSAAPGGTRDQLLAALDQAAADPQVGSVLLRGAGSAFCSGGDLTGNPPRESPAEQYAFVDRTERFHAAVRACPLPVVASVHGYCLGAGLLLATSCDIVIASSTATFGMPEGRSGLVGVTGLTSVIGRQWAKYLILTGENISAELASRIGLVLAVVDDDALLTRTTDLAERLARMPRESAPLNKRAIDAYADAAGDAAARMSQLGHDALTLSNLDRATAPDGRRFAEILKAEGMAGLKSARALQYTEPWLPDPSTRVP